jgi:polysaccharide pyruvyl transferase WcaK-like protein
MNVLAPFGFYGWGNIGDESTLQGFGRLVSGRAPALRVWLASQDPAHTAKAEPSFKYFRAGSYSLRERWARRRSRAHLIAGGTPIMDNLGEWPLNELVPLVRTAVRLGCPFGCVGVGVETLHQDRSRHLVATELAPHIVHWSVRSERDRHRLESLEVPASRITVAADMAWLLSPVDADFGRRTLARLVPDSDRRISIGVNINLEHAMTAVQPRLTSIVADALDRLITTASVRVLFLCNEVREGQTFDRATALSIRSQMQRPELATIVPNDYFTPQQMLSLISCCDVTLSSRYHFCLFSALQGVPFLALNRSDKVKDLCADLEWTHALELPTLDPGTICRQIEDLLRDSHPSRQALNDRVGTLQRRALLNHAALDALVPQRRHRKPALEGAS